MVRRLERRDRETESRREGLAKGGKVRIQVERRVEAHKLTRCLTTVNGLDEGDLDVREAGALKTKDEKEEQKKG